MKTKNAESLHKFRIEVKKIKAILTYINSNKKNAKFISLPLPIKKIFKLGGEIRQIDIFLTQLKKFNLLDPALSIKYNKMREVNISKLKLFLAKHTEKITGIDYKILNHLNNISNETIISKTKNELNKINNILKFKYKNPEQLHAARKRMKKLIYIHKILPGKLKFKLNLNLKYLDSLQDLVGKWHDLYEAENDVRERLDKNVKSTILIKKAQQTQLKELRQQFSKFDKKVKL